MKLTDLFIADLERERAKTRKAVEAVPEGKGEWKPQEKAMPLGRLTNLVATMPSWLAMMIERSEFLAANDQVHNKLHKLVAKAIRA